MKKITYLFGAGASANALPTVNQIPKALKETIDLLKLKKFQLSESEIFENVGPAVQKVKNEYLVEIIENLEWLLKESEKHASVDTFAKKLTIRGEFEDLDKLKLSLSIFFIIQQVINKPDKRYDSFFASIHNSLSDFPDNLRIVSWNYDYQFELSYLEYSHHNEIASVQRTLNINHKYGDIKEQQRFGIYKLNGTTGFYSQGGWRQHMFCNDYDVELNINLVEILTKHYAIARYNNSFQTNFSFAWEDEREDKSIINLAMNSTKETVALVIIGYSFPFFNREIDRKLIGNMDNLKSVYFQAPDADIILERFKAIRDNADSLNLYPKFDLDQFVMPNEM